MFEDLRYQMSTPANPTSWAARPNEKVGGFNTLTPEPPAANSGTPEQMAQIEALRRKIDGDSGGSLKFEGRRYGKNTAKRILSDYEQAAGVANANTPLGGMLTPEPVGQAMTPAPAVPQVAPQVSRPQALPAGGGNPFAGAAKQAGFSDFGGQAAQAKALRAAPAASSGGTK